MKHTFSIVATLAAMSIGTSASAAEHVVLILPDAYFPEVTYVTAGDTISFVNSSGAAHSIVAKNNQWSIGPIASEAQFNLAIEAGMQNTFYNKDLTDDSGDLYVEGRFSFSSAPLD